MLDTSDISPDGLRKGVGIVLMSRSGQLFWGKRVGYNSGWQFPQGGLHPHESVLTGMYRELREEVGLTSESVRVVASTQQWLTYYLPKNFRRYHQKPLCIGQKQKWFLLELQGPDETIQIAADRKPEFTEWVWVDYWYPLKHVISFKWKIYSQVLDEFKPYRDQVVTAH